MEAGDNTVVPLVEPAVSNLNVTTSKGEGSDRTDDLAILSRVSAAVSGLDDLDAILQVALDNVIDTLKGTVGGILLLDESTQTLSYRVYRGLSAKFAVDLRLKLGEGIIGKVAQSGKSILSEDMTVDPRVARPDMVRAEGLKAFACVPLQAKNTVLGVMTVASHMAHRFTSGDMYLLHSIGDQVGVAIEQAKLYERLRTTTERYRRLARQTLVAQEEERKRIARELHDDTSQGLSGAALQLQVLKEMAAELPGGQSSEFIMRLDKVQSLIEHLHTEINRLMADLHPSLLDTVGFLPAIRQYTESSLRHLGINISIETSGTIRSLTSEVEGTLFRFVQGAIGNIARHSKARNAAIILEYLSQELRLEIRDDGQGFDVSRVTTIEETGRGRGLFSMKERVRLLGGWCSVESQPGKGTIVRARVPMYWVCKDVEESSIGSR